MADPIRGLPRKPRPVTGRGRLPSLASLAGMSETQLQTTLARFGLEPDLKAIERSANRAFERLDRILEEGAQPDAATWEEINKRVEREMLGTVRDQTKAAIRNYQTAKAKESGAEGFLWLSVGIGSCKSCEKRHGQIDTMSGWRRRGLPGSSALVCGGSCRCQLQPVF